jgi:hypothetical protein
MDGWGVESPSAATEAAGRRSSDARAAPGELKHGSLEEGATRVSRSRPGEAEVPKCEKAAPCRAPCRADLHLNRANSVRRNQLGPYSVGHFCVGRACARDET